MPALLTSDDKAKIKRNIPQASNKIITAGIARLYIAFPNDNQWRDTGLSGAAVLAYDEVGKCFFFKLVDVVGSQGILWDQELYEGIQYRQDRTFFHSFEISDCIAAFSFSDEHEARNFYSKVDARQKKVPSGKASMGSVGRKMKGLFGKVDKQDISSPRPESMVQTGHVGHAQQNGTKTSNIDPNDPEWAGLLDQLASMGISEDQIAGNEEFIKSFVSQKQAEEPEPPRRVHAPPPPPPPSAPTSYDAPSSALPRSPAPPPPPPPPSAPAPSSPAPRAPVARSLPPPVSANTAPMVRSLPPPVAPAPSMPADSPRDSPDSTRKSVPPPPPTSRARNKPPPPPSRGTKQSSPAGDAPSYAPSIPNKVPLDDDKPSRVFNVPPPFEGARVSAAKARPTPPPPSIPSRAGPAVPSRTGPPPPIPGRSSGPPVPSRSEPSRPIPPPPAGGVPPPPPPPPPAPSSAGLPPPPPPMMPPPPSGPPAAKLDVPTVPGRVDLLASIRAGNKGGLKKTKTVDKSAPAVPGAVSATNTGGAAPSGGNDMASQLAAMLGERNKKVAHNSDDESDDEW